MGPLLPGPGSVSEASRVSLLRAAAGAHTGGWVLNYLGFSWPLPQSRLSLGVQWGEARGRFFPVKDRSPPPPAPCPQVFFCCCYYHFRRRPHREHLGCILEVCRPWDAMTQFLDAAAQQLSP